MKFTVLMPIHDGVKLFELKRSVKSIINSTLLPNEFLILVDGDIQSLKKNFLISMKKKYKFINLIFKKKMGLTKILNFGLNISKFSLIARADSDDVNDKFRFEKQINYFQNNDVDILGSNIFEVSNKTKKLKKMPSNPSFFNFLLFNPLNHMTVIFKKKMILNLGGYPNIKFKEDFALWFLAKNANYKIHNLSYPLVRSFVDKKTFLRRRNFQSIKSEYDLFKFIISINYVYAPFSMLILILRVIFLTFPLPLYLLIKKTLFKQI